MEIQHTPSEARSVERVAIDSSNIKSAGYSAERKVLAIEFGSGLVLHYDNVPPELFEAFGQAPSRGRFYSKEIRGKFPARTMTGLCPKCAMPGYIGERCDDCGCATVRAIDRTHKG